MKVVIDAMCAEYGGIRTYVDNLLARWSALYPDDEVHVALREGSTLSTPGLQRHEFAVGRPEMLRRPWAQATAMHRMIRRVGPDVVLATAPTTDVRRAGTTQAVVILDLRAELLPDQFSRGRRLLRKISYERAYRLADGFIGISQRSLDDLHRLHPATADRPAVVAHLGSDHVQGWAARAEEPAGPAIAFAHHTNKNPHLVVDAYAELRRRGAYLPPLTFLGVSGALRPSLQEAIAAAGLTDDISLSPFLPDDEFEAAFSRASMVVFPSDLEGFGLPAVEGMALGKAVVISPDPGLAEVSGTHAFAMADWSAAALADAITRATAQTAQERADAAAWAATFTWDDCVRTTRSALLQFTQRTGSAVAPRA